MQEKFKLFSSKNYFYFHSKLSKNRKIFDEKFAFVKKNFVDSIYKISTCPPAHPIPNPNLALASAPSPGIF